LKPYEPPLPTATASAKRRGAKAAAVKVVTTGQEASAAVPKRGPAEEVVRFRVRRWKR